MSDARKLSAGEIDAIIAGVGIPGLSFPAKASQTYATVLALASEVKAFRALQAEAIKVLKISRGWVDWGANHDELQDSDDKTEGAAVLSDIDALLVKLQETHSGTE